MTGGIKASPETGSDAAITTPYHFAGSLAGGGGGGGVVMLASANSIAITGDLDASGGKGGNGKTATYNSGGDRTDYYLGGGGGGGGLIRLAAPVIQGSGNPQWVKRGEHGTTFDLTRTDGTNFVGGAGGASAGDGGTTSMNDDSNGTSVTKVVEAKEGILILNRGCNPAALFGH